MSVDRDLLLHLPLREDLDAELAAGMPTPRVDPAGEQPTPRDDGRRAGMYFSRSCCVHYRVKSHLRREAGTVMMWFKPDWSADFEDELGRILWDVRITDGAVVEDDPSQRFALVYPNPTRRGERQSASTHQRWRWCIETNRNRYVIGGTEKRPDKRTRQAVWGSPQRFAAGTWLHVAATWTSIDGAIYIDGREDARAVLDEGLPTRRLPEAMQLGAIPGYINAGPEGVIADFRIYGEALDAAAIQAIMDEA